MRICDQCNIEKPDEDYVYYLSGRITDKRPRCLSCHRSNTRAHYHKIKHTDRYKEYRLKDRLENKAARNAKRRAIKSKAEVAWADYDKIKAIYAERDRMNFEAGEIKYHVHHEIPLNSPYVCGLHHELNLTITTAEENLSMGNRVWPGMPEIDDELVEIAKKFYEEFPEYKKSPRPRKQDKGSDINKDLLLQDPHKTSDISEV